MTGAIPNIALWNWRAQQHLSRAEMADQINASQAGIADRLACDEERIRRWESGRCAGRHRRTGALSKNSPGWSQHNSALSLAIK